MSLTKHTTPALRKVVDDQRANRLGHIVREEHSLIIEKWLRRAERVFDYGGDRSRDELVDDFPDLMRAIGDDLVDWDGETDSEVKAIAETHGRERWEQGFEIADVIRDYQILRATTTEHLCLRLEQMEQVTLTRPESLLINKILDESIVASVVTFSKYRVEADERLRAELDQKVQERTAQIAALSRALMEAEVRERERISQILHENLQQTLFAARMKLDTFAGQFADDGKPTEPRLVQADALLGEAIEAIRTLAVDLAPPVLTERGLVPGLEWLAEAAHDRFGLTVTAEIDECRAEVEALSDVERSLMFRFAQETLLNAAKHCDCTQARLRLSVERPVADVETRPVLGLWVCDDGERGQSLTDAFESGQLGFGLASLSRQARLLDGTLLVRTDETCGGANVGLTIPVDLMDEVADEAAA